MQLITLDPSSNCVGTYHAIVTDAFNSHKILIYKINSAHNRLPLYNSDIKAIANNPPFGYFLLGKLRKMVQNIYN